MEDPGGLIEYFGVDETLRLNHVCGKKEQTEFTWNAIGSSPQIVPGLSSGRDRMLL